MANGDWAKEIVQNIGAALKTARGKKSAAWLSDRTAELGYRVSPTVIAKLDSGHRGSVLSVPELLVFAAALEVPVLDLLCPGDAVEVLPRNLAGRAEVVEMFTGTPDAVTRADIAAQLQKAEHALKSARKQLGAL